MTILILSRPLTNQKSATLSIIALDKSYDFHISSLLQKQFVEPHLAQGTVYGPGEKIICNLNSSHWPKWFPRTSNLDTKETLLRINLF